MHMQGFGAIKCDLDQTGTSSGEVNALLHVPGIRQIAGAL